MFTLVSWITTGLSILGVVLNIKKRKECFIVWGITNATWMGIDIYKEIYAQGFLFGIYFLLALWGLWEWRKEEKDEERDNG